MSADKPDIYKVDSEFNNNHQPEIIPFQIENVMLISNIIRTIECFLHIGKARPLAPLHYCAPFLQCRPYFRMLFRVFFETLLGKYSHAYIFNIGKYMEIVPNNKIKYLKIEQMGNE